MEMMQMQIMVYLCGASGTALLIYYAVILMRAK